ncbi:hypothetical protein FRC06_001106 [Ceratobasidium sp. 370]|nr:hypothetical protein FRC06_001106 [Ceratobasidium sp. 370]
MGIGEIAWKYMSLFQQHLPPSTTTPGLTYDPESFNPVTSPAHKPTPNPPEKKPKVHIPRSRAEKERAASSNPENASKAYEAGVKQDEGASGNGFANGNGAANGKHKQGKEEELDPSYVRHPQQGAYIQHRGLSICTSLGEGVLFYGLDCRTDRTRERICYADTYQAMFDRLEREVVPGKTKHLLLLLGVPIAYPRLVWAETLMTSRLMAPLRMLNSVFGILSGLFNEFDGKVELLDDLEDHWAAAVHKAERNHFVQRLQSLSYAKQVRITILSGDVHLAAIGRFFSKAKLNVPQERDHRYIVNIISSAITNAPPPDAVGDVLNTRNKLHRLDHNTAENLMDIFEEGVDGSRRLVNKTTYPARNYCIITRADPSAGPDVTTAEEIGDNPAQQASNEGEKPKVSLLGKVMRKDNAVRTANKGQPQGGTERGEISGGTGTIAKEVKGAQVGHDASALAPATGTKAHDALNISLRLEVDKKSPEGKTKAYGFSIPRLER